MDTQNIILRSFESEDQENNRQICGIWIPESGKFLLVVKSREFWLCNPEVSSRNPQYPTNDWDLEFMFH